MSLTDDVRQGTEFLPQGYENPPASSAEDDGGLFDNEWFIAGFQTDGTPEMAQETREHDGATYLLTWVGDHPYPCVEGVETVTSSAGSTGDPTSYQAKCCGVCWCRYGRAISRLPGADHCDRCGEPWESARPEQKRTVISVS
mgnify:CR=1 FL=1